MFTKNIHLYQICNTSEVKFYHRTLIGYLNFNNILILNWSEHTTRVKRILMKSTTNVCDSLLHIICWTLFVPSYDSSYKEQDKYKYANWGILSVFLIEKRRWLFISFRRWQHLEVERIQKFQSAFHRIYNNYCP